MDNLTRCFDLEPKHARASIRIIKHLRNETNRKIINCLLDFGPMNVTKLYIKTRMDQGECSRRLTELKSAGILLCQKVGKACIYQANTARLEQISRICKELIED